MWIPAVGPVEQAGFTTSTNLLQAGDTIDALAADVLASSPEKFVLVGFSLGGIVALEVVRQAPQRLLGLVLVDANAGADLPERSRARLDQQQRVREGHLRSVVTEELKPAYLAHENRCRQDLLQLFMEMALDCGPDVFLKQSEALRTRPDARFVLGGIKVPTLVIGGEEDALCPPLWQASLSGAIAGSQLEILKGAGHMTPLEQPARFNSILLGWLGQTSKGALDCAAKTAS
jgi:pimeloyl-ACP methyl ester carboxylesterase